MPYAAAAVVIAGPLLIGGGPVWAQLAVSAAALLMAGLHLAASDFRVRPVPLAVVAAAAVAATALQLVPLPRFLVGWLSPEALALRTAAVGAAPAMLPLTLDVPATVLALCRGLTLLGVLVVVGGLGHRSGRIRPVIIALVSLGGALALLMLTQRWSGSQSILGLYPVPQRPNAGLFGTIINGNHAASIFGLSALLAVGLAVEAQGPLRTLAGISGGLSGIGLLSTGSRAGTLSFLVGAFVLQVALLNRRLGRLRSALAALVVSAALAVGALWLTDGVRSRLTSDVITLENQKARGWMASLRMIGDYPLTGVGRGAFEAPATAYRLDTEGVRLSHPENLVLQRAAEWGVPVTLAMLVAAAVLGLRMLRSTSGLSPVDQAAACAVLAILLHEVADFGLELPGVAVPFVAALAVVVGASEKRRLASGGGRARRKLGWQVVAPVVALWAAALAGGLWAMPRTLEADGERLARAVAARAPGTRQDLVQAVARHPADYFLELLSARNAVVAGGESPMRHINRALLLNPSDASAHWLAARQLASAGRRSQAAIEYRLVAERGQVVTYRELVAAVGRENLAAALPQDPQALLRAAAQLADMDLPAEADLVSKHAVARANGAQAARMGRTRAALRSRAPSFLKAAGRELLDVATEAEGFRLAAEALAKAGDLEGAWAAVDTGLKVHAADSGLILAGAQIRFDRGQLVEARALLRRAPIKGFSRTDRIRLEEMMARIAERQGDVEGALAARARMRVLTRIAD